MGERRQDHRGERGRTEELIEAFDRERSAAEDLRRHYAEIVRKSRQRDRQVLIERRQHPR